MTAPIRRRQGQAMAEFIIVWPTILLLLLGALQFGLIYWARATANLAAFEAARAGALDHGRSSAMTEAFKRGLAPLFTQDDTYQAITTAYNKAAAEMTYAKVEMVSPTPAAVTDFAVIVNGQRQIPNDNLTYRSAAAGGSSGMSIQDANLLKVKTTYGYKLWVPLVNKIIIETVKATDSNAFHLGTLYPDQRLPIVSYATVRMQTPLYQ